MSPYLLCPSVIVFSASCNWPFPDHVTEEFQLQLELNLRDFSLFVVGNIECIVYFASCWVTAFVSIERCVCVIIPFKVRLKLTTRPSVIAMCIIYFVAIATNLHMLYGLELEPKEVSTNLNVSASTKYHWTMVYFTEVESIVWGFIEYVFSGIVTFVSCQILLCAILMTCGLHRNTRIRVHNPRFNNSSATYEKFDNSRSNLTRPEMKLVKVVLSLSVLTIVCSIPKTIAYVVY